MSTPPRSVISTRRLLAVALSCGLLLAAGQAQERPGEAAPPIPPHDFHTKLAFPVVRIEDAATIVVTLEGKDTPVRLMGVALPEKDRDKDAAVEFLNTLLARESVYVERDMPKGAKARGKDGENQPAQVFRAPDGLWINLELVRGGFAAVEPGDQDQASLLRAYEKRAKDAGKGMWAKSDKGGEKKGGDAKGGDKKNGAASGQPRSGKGNDNDTVYVTKTGKKYHRQGCDHAKNSGQPVTLKEAKDRGLTPCSACDPPQ